MNGTASGSRRAGPSRGAVAAGQRGVAGAADSPLEAVPNLATIDDIVSYAKAAETSETERRLLLPALQKVHRSSKGRGSAVFLDQLQGDIEPLSALDPSANTLAFTYILATRAAHVVNAETARQLQPAFEVFAQALTPEALVGAGEITTIFAHGVVRIAEAVDDHVWALPVLLAVTGALCSVHGGTSNLTTLHSIVAYQGLRAKQYQQIFDAVVKYDIVSADVAATPLAHTDVLEYFYYAGLICIKLGHLDRACDLLQQCVCMPAQIVSAIHLDAYKKLMLVQLLKDGKTAALPRSASQAVTRAIRSEASSISAYTELARAYEKEPKLAKLARDPSQARQASIALQQKLDKAIMSGTEQFEVDQNVGLVKRLQASYTRRQIERLGAVFVSLTIGSIADILGLEEASGVAEVVAELQRIDAAGTTVISTTNPATGRRLRASDLEAATEVRADDEVAFAAVRAEHAGLASAQRIAETIKDGQRWMARVAEKERSVAKSEAYLGKVYTSRGRFTAGLGMDDDDDAFA